MLTPGTSKAEVESVLSTLDLQVLGEPSASGTYTLTSRLPNVASADLLAQLRESKLVQFAEIAAY